jgi:hypothetical protein
MIRSRERRLSAFSAYVSPVFGSGMFALLLAAAFVVAFTSPFW